MLDAAGGDLRGSNPGHAADDTVSWIELAEWVFVPDTILDNDERGIVVDDRLKQRRDGIWVDGLVCAGYVVKRSSGVGRGSADMVDLDFVVAMVLALDVKALRSFCQNMFVRERPDGAHVVLHTVVV